MLSKLGVKSLDTALLGKFHSATLVCGDSRSPKGDDQKWLVTRLSFPMAGLSASTWGDPNATKRVLLLHGITSSSQIWHRIAQGFTSQGYLVIAPDFVGHGCAGRGSAYTIAALADELRPYFVASADDRPYEIVVGHSLGGLVASALLPLLKSTRPVHVVLVDPPLEQTPEAIAGHRRRSNEGARHPKTPETTLLESPLWTREDATWRYMGRTLYDVATVDAIFDQNPAWSFSHLLASVPDNVQVTVLVADPSKDACTRMEELAPYPHVNAKVIWGTSHLIPMEFPQVVVDTALEGATWQH